MNKFYVYLLIDPSNNTPFYVGKGKGKRYKVHFNPSAKGQNKLKDAIIRRIVASGNDVLIKQTACDTEELAYQLETSLILLYGRIDLGTGCLANLQGGGEGAGSERLVSDSTRTKQSTARIGIIHSDITKNKIAAAVSKSGNCTAVIQYTEAGEEIARYPSARSASKATGVDGSHILYCCKGIYTTAKGFVWKYENPDAHKHTIRSKLIKQAVQKCDKDWNVIETFRSVSDAARSVGSSTSYIGRASTAQDFALGYYWRKC